MLRDKRMPAGLRDTISMLSAGEEDPCWPISLIMLINITNSMALHRE